MRIHLSNIFLIFCIATGYSQSLEGDWIYLLEHGEVYSKHLGLRFKADTLWELYNPGTMKFGKYQLSKDTLSYSNSLDEIVSYKVIQSRDSLILVSHLGSVNKYYSRKLEYDRSLCFDKITLEGKLNDRHSKVRLTINKNGKATFKEYKGVSYSKKGFRIEKRRIEQIDSAFKWSFIKRMDTTYYYGSSYDDPCRLEIEYNQSQKVAIKGTLSLFPTRLRSITWYLLNEMRKRNLI